MKDFNELSEKLKETTGVEEIINKVKEYFVE